MVMFLLGGLGVLIVQAIGVGVMIWVTGDDKETLATMTRLSVSRSVPPITAATLSLDPACPEVVL